MEQIDGERNEHRRAEAGREKTDHIADGAQILHQAGIA
jgi:hypothetical protein